MTKVQPSIRTHSPVSPGIYFQENLQLLGASEDTATWKAYVDYVDEMVVAGFVGTVVCSLQYFLDNTDAAKQPEPLLRAIMELIVGSLFPLDYDDD